MTIDQFERAIAFLEKQIEINPNNSHLIEAYVKLVEFEYLYRMKERELELKDLESYDKLKIERAKAERDRNGRS